MERKFHIFYIFTNYMFKKYIYIDTNPHLCSPYYSMQEDIFSVSKLAFSKIALHAFKYTTTSNFGVIVGDDNKMVCMQYTYTMNRW